MTRYRRPPCQDVKMTVPMSRRNEFSMGEELHKVTPLEARLVEYLLLTRPTPQKAGQIADYLWGHLPEWNRPEYELNTVMVLIYRLRCKGVPIHSQSGYGYWLAGPNNKKA